MNVAPRTAAAWALSVLFVAGAVAQTIAVLPKDEAKALAGPLVASVSESGQSPFVIDADLDGACALRVEDGGAEFVFVPNRAVSADLSHPALTQERGQPLGWLFMKGVRPILSRRRAAEHFMPVASSDWLAIPLSVRRLPAGETLVELWSHGDRPIVAVDVLTSRQPAGESFTLQWADRLLACYGLGKYVFFIPLVPTR